AEIRNHALGFPPDRLEFGQAVQSGIEETFQLALLAFKARRKAGELTACLTNVVDGHHLRIADSPLSFGKYVADHRPDHVAHQGALSLLDWNSGMPFADRVPMPLHDRKLDHLINFKEACSQAIVDVVIVVGDIVGNGGDLRLEPWPAFELEIPF